MIPFRPFFPPSHPDETTLEYERRKHFVGVGYFHTVCDAVEKNRPEYAADPDIVGFRSLRTFGIVLKVRFGIIIMR